jgi:hypothetical protein
MVKSVYVAVTTVLTWSMELRLSTELLAFNFLLYIIAYIRYVDIMIENKFVTNPKSKWFVR